MADAGTNGTTIVDFQAMSEAISSFKTGVNNMNTIVTALRAAAKALTAANVFSGGAASAFIAALESEATATEAASTSLDAIVNMLSQKLETYKTKNQEAQAIAENIQQAQWSEV